MARIGEFEVDDAVMQAEYDKDRNSGDNFGDGPSIHTFKKGFTQLRVLTPWKSSSEKFYRKVFEHYIPVNGRNVRIECLAMWNENCPACVEGKRLYQSSDKEDLERARKLRPRKQYLINAIVMSDPSGTNTSSGVSIVKFGVKVKQQLVALDRDFEGGWGHMTKVDDGFDVRVEKRGDRMENTEYFVNGVPKRTSLKEVLAAKSIDIAALELHDLDNIVVKPDPAQMVEMLEDNYVPGFPTSEPVSLPVKEIVQEVVADSAEILEGLSSELSAPEVTVESSSGVTAPDVPAPFVSQGE